MKRPVVAAALIVAVTSSPAVAADESGGDGHRVVHTTPEQGGFEVGLTETFAGQASSSSLTSANANGALASAPSSTPVVDIGTALFDGFCAGNNYTQACDPVTPAQAVSAAAPPAITNALVLRALRRVDLPASQLGVQPPGGETLVNFDTNFFTDSGAFTRSVRLLGRQVDLRIWPDRFRWVFGDGADLASTSPGARYPDLEITHAYEVKGSVSPSVDTTYAARYRVDGGPWREVTGTVTVPGEPVRLQVRTARPVLVSGH